MEENRREIYAALDIAKYVINKCTTESHPISNLQLQKILYFLQREYLQKVGRRLFSDDIQAWQFGPVVPEVYYQYCGFGSMDITMKYDCQIDGADRKRIDAVVLEKRDKNPWDLVEETHAEGKAWATVYRNGQGNHKIIPIDTIRIRG